MQKDQRVADMADEVLGRQAMIRARRTGEQFEESLGAVRRTEAGRQLEALREGPHRNEEARRWQDVLEERRAREREREQARERSRAREAAAWEHFVQTELRELELRKGGQLAGLLGEALPGEPAAALARLCAEDRRQAREGLVALVSGGKVTYKHVDELTPEDRPGRIAAIRVRARWLKERSEPWAGYDG
jgi:hypothetical protein